VGVIFDQMKIFNLKRQNGIEECGIDMYILQKRPAKILENINK